MMEKEEELIGFDRVAHTPIYNQPVEESLYPTKVEEIPLTLVEEVWDEIPQMEEPVVILIDRSYFPNYDKGDGDGDGDDKEKSDGQGKGKGKEGEESQGERNGSPSEGSFADPDEFDGDGEVSDKDPDQEGGSVEVPVSRDIITSEDNLIRVKEKDRSWFEL